MLIKIENITTEMSITLELDKEDPNYIERLCHMAGMVAGLTGDDIYREITSKLSERIAKPLKLTMPDYDPHSVAFRNPEVLDDF